MMLQQPLLLLIGVIMIVMSAKRDAVKVVSFRMTRKVKNGPAMCALDKANKTISSSSLEHCSLDCSRDATCASFNLKDSKTCDLYNYKPSVIAPVSKCENYQVIVLFSSCSLHAVRSHVEGFAFSGNGVAYSTSSPLLRWVYCLGM